MSTEHDVAGDVLGLAETFPRPGWVVLDAIRERRFTGEVVVNTAPEIRIYSDRGRIYLAERSSDPSLGARLVDAGALNATQLEHGSLRVGDSEHLGRLFERVPSVDRHTVLVTAELMTEECVGWLATQRIPNIDATPYRHHPSGAHRWDRAYAPEMAPGDPLPAPPPDAAPIDLGPPEPLFTSSEIADADDMIMWNEPSWLDERMTPIVAPIDVAARLAAMREGDEPEDLTTDLTGRAFTPPVSAPEADRSVADDDYSGDVAGLADDSDESEQPNAEGDDWIDRLHTAGLPAPGADPLAAPVRLTALPPEPVDRFELIWPSGDIDEQFGAQVDEPFPNPDIDRAGPTARLVRDGVARTLTEPVPDVDGGDSAVVTTERPEPVVADEDLERWLADEAGQEEITDEVVLAVRRAVASIETGSLAARRRLVEVPSEHSELSAGVGRTSLPGRLAVRSETTDAMAAPRGSRVGGASVFDNLPTDSETSGESQADAPAGDTEPHRTSALRRLIGSIRRR